MIVRDHMRTIGSAATLMLLFGGGFLVGSLAHLPRFTPIATIAALMSPMHATLPVRDLERAAQWYEQTLGFQRVDLPDRDSHRLLLVKASNLIELREGTGGARLTGEDIPYSVHQDRVALVVSDIDAETIAIESKGTVMVEQPRQSRSRDLRVSLVRDPNGHMLELQEQP